MCHVYQLYPSISCSVIHSRNRFAQSFFYWILFKNKKMRFIQPNHGFRSEATPVMCIDTQRKSIKLCRVLKNSHGCQHVFHQTFKLISELCKRCWLQLQPLGNITMARNNSIDVMCFQFLLEVNLRHPP